MPLSHRAAVGKLTPGHISMVIKPDGNSKPLSTAARVEWRNYWRCACPIAKSIDWHMSRSPTQLVQGHGRKGCCTSDLPMPLGDESNAAADCACPIAESINRPCPIHPRDLYEAWLQGGCTSDFPMLLGDESNAA